MQTRMELDRNDNTQLQRESFGELLTELANNSAGLVRDEIALATQEMREKAVVLRSGALILTAASVIGLIAIMAVTAAAIIGLTRYVGAGTAALIVGAGLALIGTAIAFVGLEKIKRISFKPEESIASLEEDKRWLKELT